MTEGIFFDTSARFLTFNLKKWYFSPLSIHTSKT